MTTPDPILGVPGVVPPPPMPPPSPWKVFAVVGGIVLATTVVVVVLWWAGTAGLNGDKLVTARLDALRTGLSIGIGGGGALALYLSWRRQRAAEIALAQAATALTQKDRDYGHTEADARERRITDLYTKAVEQIGADKAPVRLGGLYALERLAQDNPAQRQTIVNVICAYLRMPYSMPGERPVDEAETVLIDAYRERLQEREVRLAAQRILAHHLRAGRDRKNTNATFWSSIDLDLANATLIDLHFQNVTMGVGRFDAAIFCGDTWFSGAAFDGIAVFSEARFAGVAQFDNVRFRQVASFGSVDFGEAVAFNNSTFGSDGYFGHAQFGGSAWFSGARFDVGAAFHDSQFRDTANFRRVRFNGGSDQTVFDDARFAGDVPVEVQAYFEADST